MRISDWSSDVCSSDLVDAIGDGSKADAEICQLGRKIDQHLHRPAKAIELPYDQHVPLASERQRSGQASAVRLGYRCLFQDSAIAARSQDRGVGKEFVSTRRSRWSTNPLKKDTHKHTINER